VRVLGTGHELAQARTPASTPALRPYQNSTPRGYVLVSVLFAQLGKPGARLTGRTLGCHRLPHGRSTHAPFQVLMSPSDRRSVYGDSAHVTSPGSKSSDLARNFSGQGAESSPQPAALEQAEAATWLTRTLPTPSRPTSIKEAPIMVQRMKSLVSHSFNVERNDSSASRDR
jgi:hypothetical protein